MVIDAEGRHSSPWRRFIGDATGPTTTDADIAAPAWLRLKVPSRGAPFKGERSIDVDQLADRKTPATGGAEFGNRPGPHATRTVATCP